MVLVGLLLVLPVLIDGKCQVNLDKLSGKYPPLLIQDDDFIFPTSKVNGERVLTFNEGEKLELVCHGSEKLQAKTYLVRKAKPHESTVSLTCSGKAFKVTGKSEEIVVEKATCSRKQEPRITRTQSQCSPVGSDGRTEGLDSLVRVSLGWQLDFKFIEQIGMCVDETNYGTVWTNHTVHGASIGFKDKDPVRPSFRIDTSKYKRFFTWGSSRKVKKLYEKKVEHKTVASELGGLTMLYGEPIIDTDRHGTNFFAKGHLSPDAAFVYDVLQDATYYFMNVAPQFQSFNNGNWKALEMAVRDLGKKLGRDLQVVTGTHQVLQYPNKLHKITDIYLEEDDSFIPAPKYYWKVILDPKTDTGAAFIGLNDPHIETKPEEMCRNRCDEMASWVDWKVTDLDRGYMYCCSVEDAAKVIKSIPDVSAAGGLLGAQ